MRLRALPLLLVGLLAAVSVEAQAFNYLAFGDSITFGSFDEQNKGGYPGRLEPQLGCGGVSPCRVYNEGGPGDTTAQMLSRINNALNQRAYDVMLLMGGTNDIWQNNVSNSTIEFNLTEMYNRATARGIDTVFGAIIRFHPNGTWGTSKDGEVQDLKDRVNSLAQNRSGYFVNNWAALCVSSGCFSAHYFSGVPVPDPVGHPDASGYDIMTLLFEGEIEKRSLPGAPTPTAPSGPLSASPTTYTWNREAGNVATWYQLEIDDAQGNIHSEWHEARFDCGGGVCNVDPGVNLPEGTYTFRVRARTPEARGPWSGTLQFSVVDPPPQPSGVAPTGAQYSAAPTTLTFEWGSVSGADSYDLVVEDSIGTELVSQSYSEANACTGPSCEVTPVQVFGGGDYRWRVRGVNLGGPGTWSTWKDFTVVTGVPEPSVPGYPDRDIFNGKPRYAWSEVEFATYYNVVVRDAGGGTVRFDGDFDAGTACVGNGCGGRPNVVLTPGDYEWTVTSGNPIGEGAPSAPQAFTVLTCSPLTVELKNETVISAVEVKACQTITAGGQGAEKYVVDAGGDLTLHAGDEVVFTPGFRVLAGGKLTVFTDP